MNNIIVNTICIYMIQLDIVAVAGPHHPFTPFRAFTYQCTSIKGYFSGASCTNCSFNVMYNLGLVTLAFDTYNYRPANMAIFDILQYLTYVWYFS